MNNKGAIELSANFLVVIIISLIIVVGGLSLFFKMRSNTQDYVDAIDSQTNERLKSMMLSNNYRVAAYPQDPTISTGDAEMIGIGITNIYDVPKNFTIGITIKKYVDDNTGGPVPSPTTYYILSSNKVEIAPHDQIVKGALLKMPDGATTGQYVYTITVNTTSSSGSIEQFGVVQVYVENP